MEPEYEQAQLAHSERSSPYLTNTGTKQIYPGPIMFEHHGSIHDTRPGLSEEREHQLHIKGLQLDILMNEVQDLRTRIKELKSSNS